MSTPQGVHPLIALGVSAALAGVVGWFLMRMQDGAGDARQARSHLQALGEVLDVWQWQTDGQHRVVDARPPAGETGDDGPPILQEPFLWEHFCPADEQSLRVRMIGGSALDDIDVLRRRRMAASSARACEVARWSTGPARSPATSARCATVRPWPRHRHPNPTAPQRCAPDRRPLGQRRGATAAALPITTRSATRSRTTCARRSASSKASRRSSRKTTAACSTASATTTSIACSALPARMNSMIDALLALSKLSSQPLARQPVNLSQLAGFVADDLRRDAPGRQVELEIEPRLRASGRPDAAARGPREPARQRLEVHRRIAAMRRSGSGASAERARRPSRSPTTAPASTCASPTGCSASSSACTARASFRHRRRPRVGAAHRPAPRRRHLGRVGAGPRRALPLHAAARRRSTLTRLRRARGSTTGLLLRQRERLDRGEHSLGLIGQGPALRGGHASRAARGPRSRVDRIAVHQHADRHRDRGRAARRGPSGAAAPTPPPAATAPARMCANAASTAGTICPMSSGLTR